MGLGLAVKQRAIEIGFDLAGIAPLGACKDLEFSRRWVERGYGGEMSYLANPQRDDPRRILPSVKSLVCVGLVYNTPLPYSTEVGKKPSVVSCQLSVAETNDQQGTDNEQPATDHGPRTTDDGHAHARAWISRYAWGQDYHEIMRAKLERLRKAIEELAPGVETRVYVDTGPIVERAFARLSGIGWMGKNTCLIDEAKGSWFFLGVILTTLALEPDLPAPDRCGSCTACLEACPTGALVEPYVMNASRCISYFTIELKGSIPEAFRAKIGAHVFGCDICQDVCPWNGKGRSQESGDRSQNENDQPPAALGIQQRSVATTGLTEFQPLQIQDPRAAAQRGQLTTDDGQRTDGRVSSFQFPVSLFNPPLEALASLTEDDFRRLFARSPIKRAKYRGWLRNLCVAMGNSGDPRFVPWLELAAEHPDPVVHEHAAWALSRLTKLP